MSLADDDSQAIASPEEAPSTAPLGEAEDSASLPELEVIGAAAKSANDAESSADTTDEKPPSARERLSSRTREARPRKKRGPLIAAIILLVLLLATVGCAIGGIAYLRWYANDDALDFQGTWYVAGTDTPIEITADAIQLTDSVAYRYKLNTHDKTITLTIGNMTGSGSYRFSLDRTQLVIFDGRTDPDAIMEADLRWLIQALYDDLMNEPNDVTTGIRRNCTLLTREPNTDTEPNTPASTEGSDASSGESEDPRTVWSAEEWLNRGNGNEDGDANGTAGSSSTASDVNDVDFLLQDINDLPAERTPAPEDGGDQTGSASS